MLANAITDLGSMLDHCRLRLDDYADRDFEENGVDTEDSQLLWSNQELVLFANQAVYEVALRSKCLKDNTVPDDPDDFTTFDVAVGDDGWVSLSDLWMVLRRVSWVNGTTGDRSRLRRLMQRRLDNEVAEWEGSTTDNPTNFILNTSSRDLRVYPLPEADGVLRIEGVRLPKTSMTANDDTPEIPAHYLAEAIHWMCHLAYSKNDADAADPQRDAICEQLFTQRFGPRPTAHQLECRVEQSQSHRPRIHYR